MEAHHPMEKFDQPQTGTNPELAPSQDVALIYTWLVNTQVLVLGHAFVWMFSCLLVHFNLPIKKFLIIRSTKCFRAGGKKHAQLAASVNTVLLTWNRKVFFPIR